VSAHSIAPEHAAPAACNWSATCEPVLAVTSPPSSGCCASERPVHEGGVRGMTVNERQLA
jgi:hypothetical protein